MEWSNPPARSWLQFVGPLEATRARRSRAACPPTQGGAARAPDAGGGGGRPRAFPRVRRACRPDVAPPSVRGSGRHVTLRACLKFLQEEEYDGRIARERAGEATISAEEVYRELGIRAPVAYRVVGDVA